MRRFGIPVLASILLAVAAGPGRAPAQDTEPAREAPWADQIGELGWMLVHISTINAVNGLNLSREQIRDLRKLAEQVRKAGAVSPAARGGFSGELAEVRAAFRALHDVLLKGERTDEKLRARIVKARAAESRILRETLTPPRSGHEKGSCGRCHASPSEKVPPRPFPAAAKMEMSRAHATGLYTSRGFMSMSILAKKVDGILTEEQRAVFADFACCLIPPSNLSDPVRVGQAAVPDWAQDLLVRVRSIPERGWPTWRKLILDHFARLEDIKRPGVTEKEREAVRKRMGGVMDEARELSETDFELSREELCERLTGGARQDDHALKRAYFLLSPGAAEIYDALLERMNRKEGRTPTRPDVEAERPT